MTWLKIVLQGTIVGLCGSVASLGFQAVTPFHRF